MVEVEKNVTYTVLPPTVLVSVTGQRLVMVVYAMSFLISVWNVC